MAGRFVKKSDGAIAETSAIRMHEFAVVPAESGLAAGSFSFSIRGSMRRVCFLLKIKQSAIEDYKRVHADVWPEMLEALRQCGWHNYSLFLRPDGLLVGYLETPDFERALAGMKDFPVNEKWQATVRGYFEGIDGMADDGMLTLEEVFHLL